MQTHNQAICTSLFVFDSVFVLLNKVFWQNKSSWNKLFTAHKSFWVYMQLVLNLFTFLSEFHCTVAHTIWKDWLLQKQITEKLNFHICFILSWQFSDNPLQRIDLQIVKRPGTILQTGNGAVESWLDYY